MQKLAHVLFVLLLAVNTKAQTVKGGLFLNEKATADISLSSNKIVNLYADFRQGKHPLLFQFQGSDLVANSEKQTVVSIVFVTSIKKDGKLIASSKRAPIPFFPGNMFMPVETFDFISLLSNLQTNSSNNVSAIGAGTYEILLEAKPLFVKGGIDPLQIFVTVPDK